jgi:hypothetical protein
MDREVARAETLARWLDDRYLDPVIGFFLPGVGDLATSGVGLYVVAVAVKKRLPAVVIARMLLNLALDAIVGAIPFAGDLFDFLWKANRKNVTLLTARHAERRSTAGDWLVVAGAAALLVVGLAMPVMLLVWAYHRMFG